MKNIIAIAVLAALSTPSFAFFNDGNVDNRFVQDGRVDTKGNATGKAGGTFGFTFEADGDTAGDFMGNHNGKLNNNTQYVEAYDSNGNFIGHVGTVTDAKANGRTKGGMKFGMNFSGNAETAGDFVGNGVNNVNHNARGYGYDRPYYQFPVAPVK